jgi:hypothetical protein
MTKPKNLHSPKNILIPIAITLNPLWTTKEIP